MQTRQTLRALALAGALFFAAGARAQTQTNVSATVKDPLGIPYANGTYSIQLIPTGNNPTVNGNSIGGAFNGSTDANGRFNVSLWPNASISPGGTTWQFTVCVSPGVQPPLGIGGACTPPTAVTITSPGPQSLSATLSAVAPQLTTITIGGGGIAGSIANTQVAFGTGANTIGGNAGFLFVTPNMTIPLIGSYEINAVPMLFSPGQGSSLNNLGVGGPSTLPAITTGVNNVAVGPGALSLTTSGQNNTAVGEGALNVAGATNQKNTAVGTGALANVMSDANTAVGQGSFTTVTSGSGNVGLGAGTGSLATSSNNTLLGTQAGQSITSGGSNILIGEGNNPILTGSNNIAIMTGNPTGLSSSASNQFDVMDVIIGTGMNVPATSTVEYKGNLKVDGTCTGCSSGGVTSFSGDGTVITNSASTGAVTATIAGTSGGFPYFNSATSWASTGLLTNHVLITGGGAGGSPTVGNGDFTIDSTAHTLLAGAAGLVDLSGETGASAFKIPAQAGCTASANGAECFNTTSSNFIVSGNFVYQTVSIPGTNCLLKNASGSAARASCSALVDAGTNVVSSEPVSATAYLTATNCSSSASPAVCGSAAAGSVAVPTGTNSTLVVNTTAVTANSQIFVQSDDTLGTKLGITCNSTLASLIVEPVVTARTGGTSFTITISGTTTTNPVCLSYFIVN
jgi:hypothetical protein